MPHRAVINAVLVALIIPAVVPLPETKPPVCMEVSTAVCKEWAFNKFGIKSCIGTEIVTKTVCK